MCSGPHISLPILNPYVYPPFQMALPLSSLAKRLETQEASVHEAVFAAIHQCLQAFRLFFVLTS